jgi:putative flippase GtrA
MLSFYGIGIIGLLCSNGLLFLLVQMIGFSHISSKLATILFVTLIQFCLNKTISFKEIK